ncbi:MAG: class I SAM-dependent methyltransferase [Humibacillus sp.]|nr:class I SAM-dependent methyltransferase [Humibacillus sp.]
MSDGTQDSSYAERLQKKQGVWWKQILPVQLPYRLNLKRQQLGRTLDIGCGIGRNLSALPAGSLGVDHNASAIEMARSNGLQAMTVEEFEGSDQAREGSFDGFLVAHVLEHMTEAESRDLLTSYLPYLRPGGSVFVVCPQEVGYRSDPTHVSFTTDADISRICRAVGSTPVKADGFPFPRPVGKLFLYNEFCVPATKAA